MYIQELDLFCEIYNDNQLLEKKSVIEVMLDLQAKANELKKQTSNIFAGGQQENKINDDFISNRINNLNYDRNADIQYIAKWLKEFKIDLNDIEDRKFMSNEIERFISVRIHDFKGSSEEKEKTQLMQAEFLDFFLKRYAEEFLGYDFEKRTKFDWEYIKLTGINVEYLNSFCELIFNKKELVKSDLQHINDLGCKLLAEIQDNLLGLSNSNGRIYIERILEALKNRKLNIPFLNDRMDKWVTEYRIDLTDFPNFSNKRLIEILNQNYSGRFNTIEERKEVYQVKSDFYLYACTLECNKIIDYFNSGEVNKTGTKFQVENHKKNDEKQLTVKQAVILLDKLGFFACEEFESFSNVKKAKILSYLLGKNDKNIKNAIEDLELRPSEITKGYKDDLDTVQKLLDNL